MPPGVGHVKGGFEPHLDAEFPVEVPETGPGGDLAALPPVLREVALRVPIPMGKRLVLWWVVVTVTAMFTVLRTPALAVEPVNYSCSVVDGHDVYLVAGDLSDPRVEVRPVLAHGRTGRVADLAEMARSVGAVAAVNGGFFNAYTDMTPWGTLVIDDTTYRTGGSGGAVGITPDGRLKFAELRVQIKGGINGGEEWPNNWYAWDVNRNIDDPQAIVVFTPGFGQEMRTPAATTVTVRGGRVEDIRSGPAPIPPDGYVIGFGPGAGEIASRFSVGDTVQVWYEFSDASGGLLDWSDVSHILQGGPLLLRDGRDATYLSRHAWRDPKFFARGPRGFVGADWQGRLLMGVVSGVTMDELAGVLRKMGLKDAVALDGNASAGLYYKGKYQFAPGRKLATCLAVVVRQEARAAVRVDGRLLPVAGYVVPPGTTMVPVRGVFEHLGAQVSWDAVAREAVITRGGRRIVLRQGSALAAVDGESVRLPRAAEVRGGKMFVPLRFVVENLGLKPTWQPESRTVILEMTGVVP
ncbi:MAG: phosphodiester glycosidase family protein [Desulfotomaculales bacterium]